MFRAPIHDSGGNILGVIDMTAPYERVHPHTLGMVAAASYAIENQLKLKKAMDDLMKAYCYRQTIFDSYEAAQLAIDRTGIVTLINRKGKELLKLRSPTWGKGWPRSFTKAKNRPFIGTIMHNTSIIDKGERHLPRRFLRQIHPDLPADLRRPERNHRAPSSPSAESNEP